MDSVTILPRTQLHHFHTFPGWSKCSTNGQLSKYFINNPTDRRSLLSSYRICWDKFFTYVNYLVYSLQTLPKVRSYCCPNFTEPQTPAAQGIVQNDQGGQDSCSLKHSLAPPLFLFERALQKFTYLLIQLACFVPQNYFKVVPNRFNIIDFLKQQQPIQAIFTGAEQMCVPHWNILRAHGSLPKIFRFKMI